MQPSSRGIRWSRWLLYAVVIGFSPVMVLPFYYMVTTSLKNAGGGLSGAD